VNGVDPHPSQLTQAAFVLYVAFMESAFRPLTERQREVLDFVALSVERRGLAPTLREIADAFGFASTASAQKHVAELVRKGYLTRERHRSRGLGVVSGRGRSEPGVELPLLGTVAAGQPVESLSDPEAVSVPASLVSAGEHYALRVRGESMVDDGVLDGDLVVVRAGRPARDGEMVIALVDGEATLKRLYHEGDDQLRLQPANPAMEPIVVSAGRVEVQGVVTALLRRYG